MKIINEAMLTQKEAIEKIKNGFTDDLSPLVSCYNWVGIIIAKNQGKLNDAVVALYGLPGSNKIVHAAIEHPNGKLISEERAPKGLRNSEGFVDRPDMERHVIPMDKMERLLQENADRCVDSIFGYHNPKSSFLLTESDVRVDELFGGSKSYEFVFDQGYDYCDYQFIVPGPTGNDDPDRYVIDCRFKIISEEDNIWYVDFTDKAGHRASNKNNGKQFTILNTILDIVQDFVHRNPGATLEFSGELGQEKALQGQIYSAMLRRISGKLKSIGYQSTERDIKGDRKFVVGPVREDIVNELMGDSGTLPYTDNGDYYTFEFNGHTYKVYEMFDEFFFEVGEEGSVKPTNLNDGSQFKIINTVFAIMKEEVEKKPNNSSWSFSGEIKQSGSRITGLGRMYHAICRKDFTPWMVNHGYVAYHDMNSPEAYSFIYTKLKDFEKILHSDPDSLSYIDVSQLYGYDKKAFLNSQK